MNKMKILNALAQITARADKLTRSEDIDVQTQGYLINDAAEEILKEIMKEDKANG
jgi:hypothetical protein